MSVSEGRRETACTKYGVAMFLTTISHLLENQNEAFNDADSDRSSSIDNFVFVVFEWSISQCKILET